jgi:PAS domain-containing protein
MAMIPSKTSEQISESLREERTAQLVQASAELKKEISEREGAQEGFIESERRFRAFMDNNPAVAYIKNESGQHIARDLNFCGAQ